MAFRGYIVVQDGQGQRSTMEVNRGEATMLEAGEALDGVEAFAAAILPYIEGRIVEVGIAASGVLPAGNPADPDPDSNVEEKAMFLYESQDGDGVRHKGRISVPTVNKELAFIDNTDRVVPAFQAAVSTLLENGEYTDSRGDEIVSVAEGRQTYRNRKRRT